MVSNPPYIPHGQLVQLQTEIYRHEPHLALDGGEDGLDAIRYLVKTAPDFLRSGGIWLVEMMTGQGEAVLELLHQQGQYENPIMIQDLTGRDRFVRAYRR
jgi:release factor glutamine methyltransferase